MSIINGSTQGQSNGDRDLLAGISNQLIAYFSVEAEMKLDALGRGFKGREKMQTDHSVEKCGEEEKARDLLFERTHWVRVDSF